MQSGGEIEPVEVKGFRSWKFNLAAEPVDKAAPDTEASQQYLKPPLTAGLIVEVCSPTHAWLND